MRRVEMVTVEDLYNTIKGLNIEISSEIETYTALWAFLSEKETLENKILIPKLVKVMTDWPKYDYFKYFN